MWADAVGGTRGELVVLQCSLARGEGTLAERGRRRDRVRQLVQMWGPKWANLATLASQVAFRRGFVESAELDVQTFVDRHDELFERAPLLRHVELHGFANGPRPGEARDPVAVMRALVTCPGFARLEGLAVLGGITTWGTSAQFAALAEQCVALAVEHGAFECLRALAFPFAVASGKLLVESQALAHLERLRWPGLVAPLLRTLLPTMTKLRALDGVLGRDLANEHAYHHLPASLTELHGQYFSDADLASLAATRVAAGLERLTVQHGTLDTVAPLAAFPKLSALALEYNLGSHRGKSTVSAAVTRFTALALPTVRELRLGDLNEPAILKVIDAFGAQLELLDVRGPSGPVPRGTLAGSLRTGDVSIPMRPLLGDPHRDPPAVSL